MAKLLLQLKTAGRGTSKDILALPNRPPGPPGAGPPGAGPPGGQTGVPFGPQLPPRLHPQPDRIRDNSMAVERNLAVASLNHPFKNRDIWIIMAGGNPRDPGIPSYQNNLHWPHYVNKFLFLQLLTEEEMMSFLTRSCTGWWSCMLFHFWHQVVQQGEC